jgi:hypothetical protein
MLSGCFLRSGGKTMPRGKFSTVILPDYSKQLAAIERDHALLPEELDVELRAADQFDASPRGIDALERTLANNRKKRLEALARHFGIDAAEPDGWFRAFEALAQATLGIGCIKIVEPARQSGARKWTRELDDRLFEEYVMLKRQGMSKSDVIRAIAKAEWVPYRPKQAALRSKGPATFRAKEDAVRKRLEALRRQPADFFDLVGSDITPERAVELEVWVKRSLIISRLERKFGKS